MVCEPNEPDIDIQIPAVMLPIDAGQKLEAVMKNKSAGKFILCDYLSPSVFFQIMLCLKKGNNME